MVKERGKILQCLPFYTSIILNHVNVSLNRKK